MKAPIAYIMTPTPSPNNANQLPADFMTAAPLEGLASFSSCNAFVGSAVLVVVLTAVSVGVAVTVLGPGVVHVDATDVSPLSYAFAVAQSCSLTSMAEKRAGSSGQST